MSSIKIDKMKNTHLYSNEMQFGLAVNGMNDGLWEWDLTTNITYYSPRWKSMLGYNDNELDNILDTWKTLVHPDDRSPVLEQVHQYIEGETDSFEVEMRMQHKEGHYVDVLSRAFLVKTKLNSIERLVGTHFDITARKKLEAFSLNNTKILEMIALGEPASNIYNAIAFMYEQRHPGLRCSMLELHGNKLLHGGAPSLPKAYCDAIHGLENGPDVGSCGASTYTGKRVLVESIESDSKWADIKHVALPHGMRCCWSEPIMDSTGTVLGAFGMYYDHTALPNDEESTDLTSAARLAGIVMEREQNQKKIKSLAYTDQLTGLASRHHFYVYLESLIENSIKNKTKFSLLYLDLDNFKQVNDSLGHDVGDQLLIEVAKRISSKTVGANFVTRLSGDEFSLIIEHSEDIGATSKIAQHCLNQITQEVNLVNRKLIPSCSIGIAEFPKDGSDLKTLLKAADISLYAAKNKGRGCYAFYCKELSKKADYQFKVENDLREAIEQQQLTLVYQPQISIKTGKIIGAEALSRWHHPQLGDISPIEFIASAERIGMIKPLTEWVLKTACQQVLDWQQAGLNELKISVNISPSHFLDKDIVSLIKQVIKDTGIKPNQLELEVTEGVVQTTPENLSIFQELKELGVLIAIDDFGTGYSSFASLKHLKVDYIKIDKCFIDDMQHDKKSHLLVASMIEMGHNLEHEIIAEGVETMEQFEKLKDLGCEAIQGYLFSKPIDAEEFLNFSLSQ